MYTQVKIRNLTTGPLAIMNTWGPQVERRVARTQWKKGQDGLVKKHVLDVRQVPTAFNLPAGEEVTLPRAAANSDQIVGLHRNNMISVSPVKPKDAPQAPAEVETAKDTSQAPEGQEEAGDGPQDSTEKDHRQGNGRGKGKGKGRSGK